MTKWDDDPGACSQLNRASEILNGGTAHEAYSRPDQPDLGKFGICVRVAPNYEAGTFGPRGGEGRRDRRYMLVRNPSSIMQGRRRDWRILNSLKMG
jgi:hypothetical protein